VVASSSCGYTKCCCGSCTGVYIGMGSGGINEKMKILGGMIYRQSTSTCVTSMPTKNPQHHAHNQRMESEIISITWNDEVRRDERQ